jgi:hypothetical protein
MEKETCLIRLHWFRIAQFALVSCSLALAQSPPSLRFEVASVRQSPDRQGDAALTRIEGDNAQISYRNVRFKLLLSIAYGISEDRMSGGES